jgi:hypothetical protein
LSPAGAPSSASSRSSGAPVTVIIAMEGCGG